MLTWSSWRPQSRAELEVVADEFDAPTVPNVIEGGQTPSLVAQDLRQIGFDVFVCLLSGLFAATRALQVAYGTLPTEGTTQTADAVAFDEFEQAIGAPGLRVAVRGTLRRRTTGPVVCETCYEPP